MNKVVVLAAGLLSVSLTFGQVKFTDVTRQAGIRFAHNNGAFGEKYLPETMGPGVAFLDYDGDGWLDIFLVNGMNWPGKGKNPSHSALYRNNQDGSFTDVTEKAGLARGYYGMGVSAADYDRDGDLDIYLSGLGPDQLLRNDDGVFKDVTSQAGLNNPEMGASSVWLDYDRDGHLDLFVANYVKWSIETDIFCSLDGTNKSYCTPESYQGASPRLFRNLGNGKFEDATRKAGLFDETNKGLGAVAFDYNGDGWSDIILANDTQPNRLWENNRDGTFTELGALAGVAFSEDGIARGAMGIDVGDYDHSGNLSVVIGNFSNQMLSLFHNEGMGFFIDEAPVSEVGPASLLTLTFGCFFFDFNLDGFLDIYAANGHVENEINQVQDRVTYAQPPHLFQNLTGKRFKEVTREMGEEFAAPRVARGAAYGDYDNDGDLDLIVTACGGSPQLFRNDGGNKNNWLAVKLEGTKSNRDGIGAQVKVKAGGLTQTGLVRTGGSYCSQSQIRLTFGLGTAGAVEAVEVTWPNGKMQVVKGPAVNRVLTVRE